MTLKLAAFQHFCARFADAFLTGLSPLTYERGDWLADKESEEEVWNGAFPNLHPLTGELEHLNSLGELLADADQWHTYTVQLKRHNGSLFCDDASLLPTDSGAVPPAAPATPAGVCAPSEAPPAGPQLPMFKAKDLIETAASYIAYHDCFDYAGGLECRCGEFFEPPLVSAREKWSWHVAEPVVSALTFELQGLAYDQSHPETQK